MRESVKTLGFHGTPLPMPPALRHTSAMTWTRIRVSLLVAALALGAGTISAAPAQAADLGTITVTGANDPYSYSPITLTGAVGDTFRVVNATTGGDTVNVGTSGVDTGIVSVGALACDPIGTQASCIAVSGPGTTYTITGLGTISITYPSGGSQMPIGPLLLQAAGGGVTDPALVYPTASIDANGGTCTGSTQYIKYQGQNAASGTFTAPTADTCTRTNFSLAGWARSATGSVEWQPGSTVSIGDESFTLFAVWRPNGVQITYDANVGLSTQCLSSNGTNVTTAAERQTTPTVVPASSAAAAQAPCTPSGHTLTGWSLTGDGLTTLGKGAALPASFTGTSQTLYAKWIPNRLDLPEQKSITITGERTTVGGKPGIIVDGITTGFTKGDTVVPYFRFPGETTFSQGSARPEMGADGSFSWSRKTGKKFYVYVTDKDGSVTSNRIIIKAQ